MAKKTNTTKAKKSTAAVEPSLHALALAALKRATAQVTAEAKKAHGGEVPELPARSYPVDLALRINGDVIVAARTNSVGKDKPSFTDEELMACAYVQNVDVIKDALGLLKTLTPDEIKAKVSAYRLIRDAAAKQAKRWTRGETTSSAGAVTGAPSVRIDGSVGTRKVSLDITKS